MVEVSPSTDIMLKVSLTTSPSAAFSSSASTAASVVRKHSMVAILGAIMPLPLAMPPRVQIAPPSGKVTAASFFTVSVVMMASAAKEPPPSTGRPPAPAAPPRWAPGKGKGR